MTDISSRYMLDAIGAGITPRVGDRDWAEIWLESPEHQKVLAEIEAIKRSGLSKPDTSSKKTQTCMLSSA